MNQHEEQVLPLTRDEIDRLKRSIRIVKLAAWVFALVALGALFLFVKTITDPGFRASDGYIVSIFLALIFLLCGGISLERSGVVTRVKHCIKNGTKLVIKTHLEGISQSGAPGSKLLKFYIKMGNGKTLEVKALDSKTFNNFKSLYNLPDKQAIEMHLCQPGDIILTIIKK
jgi:hypothetical protein